MSDQKYLIYTNTDSNDSTIGKFFSRNETLLSDISLVSFLKYKGGTDKSNIQRLRDSYTQSQLFYYEHILLTVENSTIKFLNENVSNKSIGELPFNQGTKIILPKDNFKTELTFIRGKNQDLEQKDSAFYFAEKLLQLLNDPGYLPIQNLTREGRDITVELINENCQVYLWSRSLGKIIDISNFIQNLSTNKSEIGSFNFSLSPIHNISDSNFINDQDVLNYFVLNNDGQNNLDFFYKNIQYNDIIFIRFEKLKLESETEKSFNRDFEVNQSELPKKVWDMIGLVDSVSQTSNYSNTDYVINVTGRDFYKLLVEDGSYFLSLRYLNNGQTIFNFEEKNDKFFKRNVINSGGEDRGTFEYYEFQGGPRTIQDTIKFIINQLSNIEVLPDNQNIFSNYGDKRSQSYKLTEDNSIKSGVNGVWQIIKLMSDKSIEDRRVIDSSISYVDSTILDQFNKICQKPFVEFFGDTYGDEFNWVIRKPPFTKELILSFLNPKKSKTFRPNIEGNYQIIELNEKDIEGYNNMEWDDTFYSWYQIQPKDNMLGKYSDFMTGGLVGIIYFDKLCQYYGNKRLVVQDNYLAINAVSSIESEQDLNNYRSFLFQDLKYLIDSNSYLPFTRRGTIVIPKGDRRIKKGTFIRVTPTNEIFYVDSVSHSLSFTSKKVDRSTTLQVSRGMLEEYIFGQIGYDDDGRIFSDGFKPKKFSYFDIIKTAITSEGTEYLIKNEENEVEKENLSEYSVKIKLTSGIAYRNNNPGNLMFANQPDAVAGEQRFKTVNGVKTPVLNKKGQPTYWAKFETLEKGFENVIRQIKIDISNSDLTLQQFISKYSPSSENRTNELLDFYIKNLNKPPLNNITKQTKLSLINSFELAKLIIQMESSSTVIKNDYVNVESSDKKVESVTSKITFDYQFVHKLRDDQFDFFMKRKQFNLLKYK